MRVRTLLRRLIRCGCLVATVGTFAGCQAPATPGQGWLFFPAPPAEPRVQFLTWASGADEIEAAHGTFEKFVLGDEPVVQRAIQKPYGIAVREGVAYVCDTKGLSVCRLDFRNKKYSVLGVSGPGRLRKPLNVVIDGVPMTAMVKQFSTGSLGWNISAKFTPIIDGEPVKVQIGLNLTVVGSKEMK